MNSTNTSHSDSRIVIHTDGSCIGNPGPGGFAAIMRRIEGERLIKEKLIVGHERETTNNRMEMMAAITALDAVKTDEPVLIRSDSKYLIDGVTRWLAGWKANSWRLSDGKPVKNVDLWQRFDEQVSSRKVTFEWVRGHSADLLNERADRLANAQARKAEAVVNLVVIEWE